MLWHLVMLTLVLALVQFYLDDVGCRGRENRLIDCSHVPYRYVRCLHGHLEDAGVRCQGIHMWQSWVEI